MSSKEKRLGLAAEMRTVNSAKVEGLRSRRQPLSGMLAEYPSDVVIEDWLIEVKVRAEKILAKGDRIVPVDFEWLEKVDKNARKNNFRHGIVVVHRKYHNEPGVLMRWTTYMELMKRCYGENTKENV